MCVAGISSEQDASLAIMRSLALVTAKTREPNWVVYSYIGSQKSPGTLLYFRQSYRLSHRYVHALMIQEDQPKQRVGEWEYRRHASLRNARMHRRIGRIP